MVRVESCQKFVSLHVYFHESGKGAESEAISSIIAAFEYKEQRKVIEEASKPNNKDSGR